MGEKPDYPRNDQEPRKHCPFDPVFFMNVAFLVSKWKKKAKFHDEEDSQEIHYGVLVSIFDVPNVIQTIVAYLLVEARDDLKR